MTKPVGTEESEKGGLGSYRKTRIKAASQKPLFKMGDTELKSVTSTMST